MQLLYNHFQYDKLWNLHNYWIKDYHVDDFFCKWLHRKFSKFCKSDQQYIYFHFSAGKRGDPRNAEQILENELLHSDIRQVVSSLGLQQAEGWPSQLESNRELILGGFERKIGTI